MTQQRHEHDEQLDPADQVIELDDRFDDDEDDDDFVSGYADDGGFGDETDDGLEGDDATTGEYDLEARYALKRVSGLRTELEEGFGT